MSASTFWRVSCVLFCVLFVAGCGEEPPPVVQTPPPPVAPPPPPPPPAPKPITLAALSPVTLEAGAQTAVELKVERNGNEGPIQVKVDAAPEGITAKTAEIAADQSAGKLELAAAQSLGDTKLSAKLTVTVKVGEQSATQALDLTVPELGLPTFLPSNAVLMQPGTSKTVDVTIQRGIYQGPVELRVEGAPAQVTCKVAPIAAGQSATKLEVATAAGTPNGSHSLRVVGTLYGRTLTIEVPVQVENRPFVVNSFKVVTLAPGQTQRVEVPVERRGYQGPLKIKADGLPEGVTIRAAEVSPDQTKAILEITADVNAVQRVRSSKVISTAGQLTSTDPIVIRIAGGDETYLPPAITSNPDIVPLLRRGSIGGRLTAATKQALLDFYGGTPESEAAVMRGLKWLAEHQRADGSWPLKDYGKDLPGCDCQTDFESKLDDNNTAGTALAILPFLGAGVTHNRAPDSPPELAEYKEVVQRALVYLGRNQTRSKDNNDGHLGGGMYAHALGTIAFCEAYGLSADEKVKVNAQLAIKYLLNAQHEQGGGWRYGPKQPGDMSVTGWVFLAIRSAQLTGIEVLRPPLTRAGRFVDSCAVGPPEAPMSRYAYLPGQPEKLSLSAAGLLTRQYLGWKRDEPDLQAGAKYLIEHLPPESGTSLGPIYYYYYATQVLHHMEGTNFDLWNHRMREHLIRTQEQSGHKAGSWDPKGTEFGERAGRLYATGMALITLEVYYRHLPMYRVVKLTGSSAPPAGT